MLGLSAHCRANILEDHWSSEDRASIMFNLVWDRGGLLMEIEVIAAYRSLQVRVSIAVLLCQVLDV